MALGNIRVVKRLDGWTVNPTMTGVYPGVTGEARINVHRVKLSPEPAFTTVTVELSAGVEFDGLLEVQRVQSKEA